MAKAVRGFFRPIGKVLTAGLKQVAKVVTKVVPGGDKLVKHVRGFHHKYGKKILKAVAVAAAIYFTGGAALGAISGAAAGTGAWAGAMTGLSASWAGVTGAGSALMAGNLSGAGASLGAGWAGAGSAGAAASLGATGAQATAAALSSGAGFGQATGLALGANMSSAGGLAASGATSAANAIGTARNVNTAVDVAKQGSSLLSNPVVQQALVKGGADAIKGGLAADSANKTEEQRQREAEDARNRYNANMGGRLSAFDTYIPPADQQRLPTSNIFERARY